MLKIPLDPPSFFWPKNGSTEDPKIKDWIEQIDHRVGDDMQREWDVVLFGVPLSRSSISVSGASEFPEFFRRAWKGFSTFNLDYERDLVDLKVADLGDVKMHTTDIPKCHTNIREVMAGVKQEYP
ncbi:MAG: arginase family protein, partial [Bacillota bacterium]|nr:arginase family protein [Bacillota bacterium]